MKHGIQYGLMHVHDKPSSSLEAAELIELVFGTEATFGLSYNML